MLTFSPLLPSKNKTRPPPARRAASTCRRASRSSRRSTAGTWRRRRLDERRHCDSEKSMSARRRRRRRRRGQDIFLQRETAMGYTWTAKRAGVLVEVLHHLIFLPCRALAHPFFGLGPPWALACESRNHALCRPPRRIGLGGPQPSCVVQPQTPPPPPHLREGGSWAGDGCRATAIPGCWRRQQHAASSSSAPLECRPEPRLRAALTRTAARWLMEQGVQLVLLGSGSPELEAALR